MTRILTPNGAPRVAGNVALAQFPKMVYTSGDPEFVVVRIADIVAIEPDGDPMGSRSRVAIRGDVSWEIMTPVAEAVAIWAQGLEMEFGVPAQLFRAEKKDDETRSTDPL